MLYDTKILKNSKVLTFDDILRQKRGKKMEKMRRFLAF